MVGGFTGLRGRGLIDCDRCRLFDCTALALIGEKVAVVVFFIGAACTKAKPLPRQWLEGGQTADDDAERKLDAGR